MFEKKKAETSLYHDEKLSRSPQDLETYLKKINRMLVFNIKLATKKRLEVLKLEQAGKNSWTISERKPYN